MSIVTQGVTVPLSLGLSGLNRGLGIAGAGLAKLQKAANITLKVGGFVGGATALGVIAGTSAAAADLEQKMAKLRRAADITDEGFVRLGVDLKRFAGYVDGIKLDSAFEIATIGAKMGVSGDQLNLFTRDIAKLRVAIDEADLPTEEMTNRIGSMLDVFHRGTDEALRLGSALNRLDLMSTASARDILDVSSRMSGTASFLGMSPQKVLALATALRQARVPIETAGTAMSQIMGRMASKKDSGGFARLAGMNQPAFQNLLGSDPLEAIKAVEQGLRRLDKIRGIQALDKLHLDGQRVRGTLLQLGTVMGDLDKFVKASEEDWASMGSVMKSNAIMGATMNAQWTKLANNFKLTAASIGEAALPALKGLVDGLVRLMHDIRTSIENNKETFKAWGERIGTVLGTVGAMWRNFPLYVTYARIVIEEKLAQIAEIFKRFGERLKGHYVWLFKSSFQVLVNAMTEAMPALIGMATTIGEAIGNNMGVAAKGAFTLAMAGAKALHPANVARRIMGAAQPILGAQAAGGGLQNRLFAGVQPHPGFGGMFNNLPNRANELRAQGGLIMAANALQKFTFNLLRAADAAKDANARAAAEKARAGPVGPNRQVFADIAKRFRPDLVRRLRGAQPGLVGPPKPLGAQLGPKARKAVAAAKAKRDARKAMLQGRRMPGAGRGPIGAPMGGQNAPAVAKEPIDEAVTALKLIDGKTLDANILLAQINTSIQNLNMLG